ncbi:MAG: carboxypeptidase-like regulatory domain-containing protein [Deferribacteres bacterium]|nr:carboxypeptidase-like regulatory domain-containing protein [candidate division KSB1 bacterium]MCB9511406.1 carboxypeptidase-like regulatory domain-containing protein [Deferribacteres bacterium]
MGRKNLLLIPAFLFLLKAIAGSAPLPLGTTGKIAGVVIDANTKEPLPGVNVIVDGTTLGAATNLDGKYTILNVQPGVYKVRASFIGYQISVVEKVKVSIDLTTTVNFELSETVLEMGEEVVIVASRPIVQKDLTSSEAHVSAEQIANLPVQEFSEVLNLQAGITTDDGGGTHIRGGRASEIAYWIDGRPVSDVYDGALSLEVENESIQALQVVSGTFNAEYGNAMSGIVNIVTKEGNDQYEGQIRVWGGDYFSTESSIADPTGFLPILRLFENDTSNFDVPVFKNIEDVGLGNYNLQGSLSGPVPLLGKKMTFFATARYYKTDGWLYGQRYYTPNGVVDYINALNAGADPSALGNPLGDGAAVPMNNRDKLSGQMKLTFKLAPTIKVNLGAIGSLSEFRDYNHDYRWNPDGDVNKYDRGYDLSMVWTHTLNSSTFYTLNASRFFSEFEEYTFENPLDPNYVDQNDPILARSVNTFWFGGTNLHRFKRNTTTVQGKFDLTTQITPVHQVKFGAEFRRHRLFLDDINLQPETNPLTGQSTGRLIIPDISELNHDTYSQKPIELSAYLQDKIEYKNVIINAGLRFDYFNSKGNLLADPSDPNIYDPFTVANDNLSMDERQQVWYNAATAKSRISPRFGIAYPITDRGVIHFSYGHFLQVPSFLYLYNQPGFKVNKVTPLQGVYGNADLEPQKTVMYELGLQQQLTDLIGIDVTGFYRDVRDWISTGIPVPTAIAGISYVSYTNRDYANVRGLTIAVNSRHNGIFSFNMNYTFQVAEGTNSDPNAEFSSLQNGNEPTRQITPLDWDQRHTFNAFLNFGKTGWGVNLLGRYGSGLPYTPNIQVASRLGQNLSNTLLLNSRRRPSTFSFDIKAYKDIKLGMFKATAFFNIFNVFDRRNEVRVFGTTGKADETLDIDLPHDFGYFVRPDHFSEPREVQIGLELGF